MNPEQLPPDEAFLRAKLQSDPADWETRRRLARALYDKDQFEEAAEVIWTADPIPNTDLDLAFAARILAKAKPHRAIRLLAAVLDLNRGKAVQNMGMANALLHHGMVLQAARFYGAALEADGSLVNPELEHFLLWTDDEMRLWADFKGRRPKLGDLPWMARDPMEALKLTSRVSLHTTPISVPSLPTAPGEELTQEMYRQEAVRNGKITPPPAVTIPIDRVDPKDRRFDEHYGAQVVASVPSQRALPVVPPVPVVPAAALAPEAVVPVAPEAAPELSESVPVPMAIPVPDNIVPVHVPAPAVTPTVPLVIPPPARLPSTGPMTTVVKPSAPVVGVSAPQAAGSPTRRLLIPGVKPVEPAVPPTTES